MLQSCNDPGFLTTLLHQLFEYIINGHHRISTETASSAALVKLEPPSPGGLKRSRQLPPGTIEHLLELDEDFPAADGGSRRAVFRGLVDVFLCRRDSRAIEVAVERAFQELHRQNEVVLILREAIDFWTRTFKPSPLDQLRIGIAVQTETVAGSFPAIPCLREELGLFVARNSSCTVARALAGARLARPVLTGATDEVEYRWWRDRLPDWNRAAGNEASSSCCSRISKSGSVDSRMAFDAPLGVNLAWATIDNNRSPIL
jgi:hypothetical protein